MPSHFKTMTDGSFLYAGVNPIDKMVVVGKIQSEGPGEIQTELRSYRIPRGEVQDVAIVLSQMMDGDARLANFYVGSLL